MFCQLPNRPEVLPQHFYHLESNLKKHSLFVRLAKLSQKCYHPSNTMSQVIHMFTYLPIKKHASNHLLDEYLHKVHQVQLVHLVLRLL